MLHDLYTPQGEALTGTPWEVYPRPQMRRDSYLNLNGTWDFAVCQANQTPVYEKTIQVPFCPESRLSGIGAHFAEGSALWYRRKVFLPEGFVHGRVLLHVGAADQELSCYVNGQKVGSHAGGYEAMTFDITDALASENEIAFVCFDDLRNKNYPYGKQTQYRGGMWYTPVSGIWQTVWLESVPQQHIEKLKIENRGYGVTITTQPALEGTILVEGLGEYPLNGGKAEIIPENPHLWSPEDPYLYQFTLRTQEDTLFSYFAIRRLEIQNRNGVSRLCLNGKPYFFHGLLDQGYWPDGLFTPASPECYSQDILEMKRLGFNTLRKHIKVEPEEFYYQCDKLGMVVFQDMVNNGEYNYLRDTILPTFFSQHKRDKNPHNNKVTQQAFLAGAQAAVQQLWNHPCICYWTIFNEGWGQFDSDKVFRRFKKLDDTRFVDATSGWFRRKESDVESLHIYFGMWHRLRKSRRPIVLSEFGGFVYSEPEHIFHSGKAYGYGACKTRQELDARLQDIYSKHVIPAIQKGLCGSIYTQVSDVEDEINGLLTYDRRICKPDQAGMLDIANRIRKAMEASTK